MLYVDSNFEGRRVCIYDEGVLESGLYDFPLVDSFEMVDGFLVQAHMRAIHSDMLRALVLNEENRVEGVWAAIFEEDRLMDVGVYRSDSLGQALPGYMKRLLLKKVLPFCEKKGAQSYCVNAQTEDGRLFVDRLNNWDPAIYDRTMGRWILDIQKITGAGQHFNRDHRRMTDWELLAALG